MAAVAAVAVSLTLFVPQAKADDLTARRDQIRAQQAAKQQQLEESSHTLNAAIAAVDAAQSRLAAAQAQLNRTRVALAAAQRRDQLLAAKLVKARQALARARAAVRINQQKLDAEKRSAGEMVRDQYQKQSNLMPVAMIITDDTATDLQTRLQWSTTLFDTTAATIDRTQILQAKLDAEKAKKQALEAEIAADRKAAAANVVAKRNLANQAVQQQASVAQLVSQRQAVQSQAAGRVAQDRREYAALSQERASVERRLAARIAAARAAAAKRAAAARAARARAAQAAAKAAVAERARRAAAASRQQAKLRKAERNAAAASAAARREAAAATRAAERSQASKRASRSVSRQVPAASSSGGSGGGGGMHGASHGFSFPVNAPITSPYGRRFHPVLHYWKLHDGTDFGAGCGTPIRAPYSGKVVERYYNRGYGNRLIIDHGTVDGRYVTTAYNHATRYVVGVGAHVSKGQVIGYVGTTGYSTGCHLHLMVWLDGRMVNPMSWF